MYIAIRGRSRPRIRKKIQRTKVKRQDVCKVTRQLKDNLIGTLYCRCRRKERSRKLDREAKLTHANPHEICRFQIG